MRPRFQVWLLTVALPLAACSSGSSGGPIPVARETIDASGGTIAITGGILAGTSLSVPAGSLTEPVTIDIFGSTPQDQVGLKALGPAALFAPDGTSFAPPATATLVFDPTELPPMVLSADLRVQALESNGLITELTPSSVDLAMGLVTVALDGFTSYWVTAPDNFLPLDYFPLNNGDLYEFAAEGGPVILSVADSTTEPNLAGMAVSKLFLQAGPVFLGVYLNVDPMGAILDLGDFEAPAFQEVLDMPALLLNGLETVGNRNEAIPTYMGFSPFGSTTSTYMGIEYIEVEMERRVDLSTELGFFRDTILLALRVRWDDDSPSIGDLRINLWLAENVGPVQLQIDGLVPAPLVSGIVAGVPVSGS